MRKICGIFYIRVFWDGIQKMRLRKTFLSLLAAVCCTVFCSCSINRFDGFYKENLSKYLTLGEYKGVAVTEYNISVSDGEVDAAVLKALETLSELQETENGISDDSTVKYDSFCFIGGESVPELSAEGNSYFCGDTNGDVVAYELVTQMQGMKKGDTAELHVMLPSGYISENSPVTEATYRVTVLAVYERIVPSLTDEVAEKLVPGCGGALQYRHMIRTRLENEKSVDAEYKKKAEVWNKIVDASVLLDAPYDVYSEYYNELYLSYKNLADAQSEELSVYIKDSYGMTEKDFENMIGQRALALTKEAFVLYSVVRAENIAYTEEELSAYASSCAASSEGVYASGEDYLDFYGEEYVAEMLLKDKVTALALSASKPAE